MSRFVDIYLPDRIKGFPFTSSPRTSTTITGVANGFEHANRNWKNPLHYFTAPEGVQCMDDIEDLKDHWMALGGPFLTFAMRDPMDFASRKLGKPNVVPSIGITDQLLGVGDGVRRVFQLQKTYTRGPISYTRPIYIPVIDTVAVGINALPIDTADPVLPGGPYVVDVERYGGTVTFDHAPQLGQAITAGFLFDCEVRFEADDSFDAIVQSFQVSGHADLSFWEVRPCNDRSGT